MKQVRGNILFLILLAVALFAALSYAVTQSNRSGGNNISAENAELAAGEMLQYIAYLRSSIERMRLIDGTRVEHVDFNTANRLRYDGTSTYYNNTNCTTTACELFHPDGGGATYRHFEEYAVASPTGWQATWVKPGHMDPVVFKVIDVGSGANEVGIRILAIEPEICVAFNRKIGAPDNPSTSTLSENFISFSADTNTALAVATPYTFGDDQPDTIGMHEFCYQSNGHNYGIVWAVLIPR